MVSVFLAVVGRGRRENRREARQTARGRARALDPSTVTERVADSEVVAVTYHVACHDCPIELVTDVERFGDDLAEMHRGQDGHDVSVARVDG